MLWKPGTAGVFLGRGFKCHSLLAALAGCYHVWFLTGMLTNFNIYFLAGLTMFSAVSSMSDGLWSALPGLCLVVFHTGISRLSISCVCLIALPGPSVKFELWCFSVLTLPDRV